jgi:hypothetical protein
LWQVTAKELSSMAACLLPSRRAAHTAEAWLRQDGSGAGAYQVGGVHPCQELPDDQAQGVRADLYQSEVAVNLMCWKGIDYA